MPARLPDSHPFSSRLTPELSLAEAPAHRGRQLLSPQGESGAKLASRYFSVIDYVWTLYLDILKRHSKLLMFLTKFQFEWYQSPGMEQAFDIGIAALTLGI